MIQNFKKKIDAVKEKQNKYSKIFEEKEKNKDKIQHENYFKNNRKYFTGYQEPKCPFYDSIPSISTNKGFTFGKKYEIKEKNAISPEYGTFLDDFEKLIEKNKKRIVIKPLGPKIPENKSIEVGDSSKMMEKMKIFEERRRNLKKNAFTDFFEDRKYKKDNVLLKKMEIKARQDKDLEEQILKTYKDENYLIRDINYDQVEQASPSFTMRAKYEIGSVFHMDKHDKDYDFSHSNKKINVIENPDFSLIRPRYPAFSFGNSKRFNSISIDGRRRNRNENILRKRGQRLSDTEGNEIPRKDFDLGSLYFYGPQDSQSFLKMQTTMGTGKRLNDKDNGSPGPNLYNIKGFADLVKLRGDKINEIRKMLIEKKKLEDIQKQKMAKLREERFEEKKKNLKLSIKDIINGTDNNINNKNETIEMEMHLDDDNEKKEDNSEDNDSKKEDH